jgi:hypothetical protein
VSRISASSPFFAQCRCEILRSSVPIRLRSGVVPPRSRVFGGRLPQPVRCQVGTQLVGASRCYEVQKGSKKGLKRRVAVAFFGVQFRWMNHDQNRPFLALFLLTFCDSKRAEYSADSQFILTAEGKYGSSENRMLERDFVSKKWDIFRSKESQIPRSQDTKTPRSHHSKTPRCCDPKILESQDPEAPKSRKPKIWGSHRAKTR